MIYGDENYTDDVFWFADNDLKKESEKKLKTTRNPSSLEDSIRTAIFSVNVAHKKTDRRHNKSLPTL